MAANNGNGRQGNNSMVRIKGMTDSETRIKEILLKACITVHGTVDGQ